jgi:P27 family predicted phage terminase small subunit
MTRAPRHLSRDARQLFTAIVDEYELEPHHLAILITSLEAFDRSCQARDLVVGSGILIKGRLGDIRVNPAVAIERNARTQFLAGIKALGLDLEALTPPKQRR